MHKAAGGVAVLALSYLGGFVLVKGESPRGFSIPILVVVLVTAAVVWWFTRPPKNGEPKVDSQHQETGNHSPAVQFQHSPVTIHQAPSTRQQPNVFEPTLNRALADGLAELESNFRKLIQAKKDGYLEFRPSDNSYRPLANRLTDHGWHKSRRILDDAYGACADFWERLNAHGRGWEDGPGEFASMEIPTIEDSDNLPHVLRKVKMAIGEIRERQERLASS